MLCFALRVSEKPSWAGVALGGMARWATSASVALAEHGFSPTKYPFILKTATRGRGKAENGKAEILKR
jgi:hypothetical protein